MNTRIRTATCAGLLASQFLTGCTSWKVVEVSPRALVDSAQVKSIKVTERNGLTYVIEAPRLVGDSLAGGRREPGQGASGYGGGLSLDRATMVMNDHRVAFTTIKNLSVRKIDALKTTMLGVVLGLVTASIISVVVFASTSLYGS